MLLPLPVDLTSENVRYGFEPAIRKGRKSLTLLSKLPRLELLGTVAKIWPSAFSEFAALNANEICRD